MNQLHFIFYISSIYALYCSAYLLIPVDCLGLRYVVPNIVSYLMIMIFIVLQLKKLVTREVRMLSLIYIVLQTSYNIYCIIQLQIVESCESTYRAENILYLIVLYTNFIIYYHMIKNIRNTQVNYINLTAETQDLMDVV